jgi:hypothetical protein
VISHHALLTASSWKTKNLSYITLSTCFNLLSNQVIRTFFEYIQFTLAMSVTKDSMEGNDDAAVKSNGQPLKEIQSNATTKTKTPPPKISLDTSSTVTSNAADPTAEFIGDVDTDNTIPSQALLHKVADFQVLDQDGKSRPFKSLYSGPMVARRVLVIFVRHFFCGVRYCSSLSAPCPHLSPC